MCLGVYLGEQKGHSHIFYTFLAHCDYYCRVSLYQEKGKGAPSDRGIRIRMSHGKNIGFPDASSNTQWLIAMVMHFYLPNIFFNWL